jgi:hypothetical protein
MKAYDIISPENTNVTDLSERKIVLPPRRYRGGGGGGGRWLVIAAVLFLISSLVLGVVAYFFFTNRPTVVLKTSGTDQASIIYNLGQLITLPSDEKPVLTPVTDTNALKSQTFFVNATSGDVLVLYVKNHLAVLYNPVLNKIVNMSKITAVVIPPPTI